MNPFAMALDALFDSDVGTDATIITDEDPDGKPIRVIRGQPDRDASFGDGRVVEGTNIFEIRRSEVAEPVRGNLITIGTETFRLLGTAMLDVEGLTWTIGATEVR